MAFTNVPAAGGASSLRVPTLMPLTGDIQLLAGDNISITEDQVNGTFTFAVGEGGDIVAAEVQTLQVNSATDLLIQTPSGTVTINSNTGPITLTSPQGVLMPNVTEAERDLLEPVAGTVVYNTTSNKLNVFTTVWEEITSAA